MKKFGFSVIAAGGLGAAVVLGLAAPAQAAAPAEVAAPSSVTISAGVDHLGWLDQLHPKPMVPKVDNTVRHSGR
ncbi:MULTISPECIES: hypothetical protein [Mycolicibacterium]|jgi:hypothetical protein|uniref:Uncharacterized protein n=2 Tax=Mycolicibacterium TaxID=1866885 RepID=A0A378W837_9MYCO|nr:MULTISPECIES: hypothetical protein [Mycolicibacterium]KLI08945.1 hypothetical protein AA982_05525 [Mycolicibacterium senegalense]KLO52980.1 hypothetical protein ABW05_17230 [Mycolicibacterium senegalense]KMV14972.1 hypothetical protein ACT17_27500 [Mycolicibacterium conceptionense]MCV7337596.1 hypothetical protein [Mycolicibacterium senegalense]MCW1823952.1 hypothetical protein [Mycolicibacterium senegalense]